MTSRKDPRYHTRSRLWALLGMLVASFALILFAGWWYTTVRVSYLTAAPLTVEISSTRPLAVDTADGSPDGVLSAAETLNSAGERSGYVVVSARNGYKSVIKVESTFTADRRTLAAIRVLAQNETEYLGERVAQSGFTGQFTGRRMPLRLTPEAALGSPIDALSGSTISSAAVVEAVNGAYAYLQALPAD